MSQREWKRTNSRKKRLWSKVNRNPDIPRPTLVILGVLMVLLIFFGTAAFIFITDVIPNSHGPITTRLNDPFSTLWNGQILNTTNTPTGPIDNSPFFHLCSTTVITGTPTPNVMTCVASATLNAGIGPGIANLMFVAGEAVFATPGFQQTPTAICATVTPTFGSGVFTIVKSTYGSGSNYAYALCVWSSFVSFSIASYSVNFTGSCFCTGNGGTGTLFGSVNVYQGTTSIGASVGTAATNNTGACPSCTGIIASPVTENITLLQTGSGIYSFVQVNSCGPGLTYTPPQNQRNNGCNGGTIPVVSSDIISPGQLIGVNNYKYSTTTTGFAGIITVELDPVPQNAPSFTNTCYKSGYVCFNTKVGNGNLLMTPLKGLNMPAIAISNSTVNLSNCAAKSCAFSMSLCNANGGAGAGCSSFYNNEEVIWFLRLNGTMPSNQANTPFFNPLFDNTVALAVVAFRNGTNTDFGVYIQRHPGAQLSIQPSDDVFQNSNGACPVNNNLIICDREATGGFGMMSLSLNFTGAAVTGSTTSGPSYLCVPPTTGITFACLTGGNGNLQISFNNKLITSFSLPWLNLQQTYHVGWWQAPQPNSVSPQQTIEADTSNFQQVINSITVAPFEIISYFVPCTPTTCTTTTGGPAQDTGGFFGWLGQTLGGAWNVVTGAVGAAINAVAPMFDLGNGLLQVFISALIQFFTFFVEGFRLLFNVLGNLFGLGNMGDLLIAVFTNIANFTIHFVEATFGWVGNAVNLLIAFANVITNFLNNGLITVFTNFIAGPILTILGLVWTVVNVFFRYSVASSYMLMVDWLFGMLYVWVSGVRGFVAWINFNIFIFTKVFRALYFLLQEAYKVIITIIGVIRGSGTGTSAPI